MTPEAQSGQSARANYARSSLHLPMPPLRTDCVGDNARVRVSYVLAVAKRSVTAAALLGKALRLRYGLAAHWATLGGHDDDAARAKELAEVYRTLPQQLTRSGRGDRF